MGQSEMYEVSAVQKQMYELFLITPMVMHGLNNRNEAEFRTASLKGAIRYWWRTLQFDKNKQELLEEEVKWFGGINTPYKGKSPISIIIPKPLNGNKKINILPHKKPYYAAGIEENKKIDVVFQLLKGNPYLEMYHDYFTYFLHLAGMGQRARRGFGSCQLKSQSWSNIKEFAESLYKVLKNLNVDDMFTWNDKDSCLLLKKGRGTSAHPTLYAVYIGKGKETAVEVLKDIGTASHFGNPRGSLGSIGQNRKSSPLWCTVKKVGSQYYPIISELRTFRKEEVGGIYEQDKKVFLEKLGVI